MSTGTLTFDREGLQALDRRAVEEFGIPTLVLMENAGRAVALAVQHAVRPGSRVLIVCGPGNNGGDGLVAARHLHNAGADVMVLLLAPREKFTEAGAIQLKIIDAMNLPVEILTPGHAEFRDWLVEGSPGDIVVDALFGTGLSRTIEGLTREVIDAINKCGRRVISIDIPSGLDCDTGQPLGIAIKAAETVSFCGLKKGFEAGRSYVGKVIVADIGAPVELLRQLAMK